MSLYKSILKNEARIMKTNSHYYLHARTLFTAEIKLGLLTE